MKGSVRSYVKGSVRSYGFPCFAEAYKSGGLKALLDRLEWFCELAETSQSETLYAGREIEDDD